MHEKSKILAASCDIYRSSAVAMHCWHCIRHFIQPVFASVKQIPWIFGSSNKQADISFQVFSVKAYKLWSAIAVLCNSILCCADLCFALYFITVFFIAWQKLLECWCFWLCRAACPHSCKGQRQICFHQ